MPLVFGTNVPPVPNSIPTWASAFRRPPLPVPTTDVPTYRAPSWPKWIPPATATPSAPADQPELAPPPRRTTTKSTICAPQQSQLTPFADRPKFGPENTLFNIQLYKITKFPSVFLTIRLLGLWEKYSKEINKKNPRHRPIEFEIH